MHRNPTRPPWWVALLTDGGRPLITAVVLTLCAPGEHQLGVMAGWNSSLAWGVAFVFAAYAGIAAVIAARRPKGTPGHATARYGSLAALALAMAAQPIAHLYARGVWQPTPHDTVWLIVGVSCIPALVLAHLLHLAAQHVTTPTTSQDEQHDQAPPTHMTNPEQPPILTMVKDEHPPEHATTTHTDSMLTADQVMTTLGVSRATLTRWGRSGRLTHADRDAHGRNLYRATDVHQAAS